VQKRLNRDNKKGRKWGILLLFLIILLFLIFWFLRSQPQPPVVEEKIAPEGFAAQEKIVPPDTADTVKDTVSQKMMEPEKKAEPEKKKPSKIQPSPQVAEPTDTVAEETKEDSLKDSSILVIKAPDPCEMDTAELWVYPDPSGGLHRRAVSVKFFSNKKGSVIRWRFRSETDWTIYRGDPVKIAKTDALIYEAEDTCGKKMEKREEFYEIEQAKMSSVCPQGMEHIKVGSSQFCIDQYEWPNRKGAVPLSYISFYQASDSCFSAGKRLCTSEEWYLACTGPHSWAYPYGQAYERYACATHDTAISASGSRPECRGYFGVYDMSGSLLEWTDTRALENKNFYYVQGGFHMSGQKSGCSDRRYSYYPQNRHNPVGFRCCSDIGQEQKASGGK